MPALHIETESTTTHTMKFSDVEICEALRSAGHKIPADATVIFKVPGGGDWSNADVEISVEHPLAVRWQTKDKGYGV